METEMTWWEDIWSFICPFFWGFAIVAYLFALVAVIGDVIRDPQLNGWAKAAWLAVLFFVPFLTVLVYVIARGRGMAQRSVRSAQAASDASDSYIRSVAGTSASPSDEIAKAQALLGSGAISQAEYERLKAHALSSVHG
jgi:hypothetical protein